MNRFGQVIGTPYVAARVRSSRLGSPAAVQPAGRQTTRSRVKRVPRTTALCRHDRVARLAGRERSGREFTGHALSKLWLRLLTESLRDDPILWSVERTNAGLLKIVSSASRLVSLSEIEWYDIH